jgi:hypothetical protein
MQITVNPKYGVMALARLLRGDDQQQVRRTLSSMLDHEMDLSGDCDHSTNAENFEHWMLTQILPN